MTNKLSFKDYLQSKQTLLESINQIPRQTKKYTVSKYCKLAVIEHNFATSIKLKPTDTVTIDWLYENITDPTISAMSVSNSIADSSLVIPLWPSIKIQKWLMRNTI